MKQTWRWFGPSDLVTLAHVKQAGATGVVSALHHMNQGDAWPAAEVLKRKAEIEAIGLVWSVVESISVHEDIKTRSGDFRTKIENYKQSIRTIAAHGSKLFATILWLSLIGQGPTYIIRCPMGARPCVLMSMNFALMIFLC